MFFLDLGVEQQQQPTNTKTQEYSTIQTGGQNHFKEQKRGGKTHQINSLEATLAEQPMLFHIDSFEADFSERPNRGRSSSFELTGLVPC